MNRPTLIFVNGHFIKGEIDFRPGEEVPPGLFSQNQIDRALDQCWIRQYDSSQRQSLYRLFHRFTGSKSAEQPTKG